uniref:Uncharacterized protein n=1 Tax=Ciona savignyi TaxID=51511 RepID=H2ZPL0_CIOSA
MHHWVVMLVKQHTEATTHADLCKTTEDFFSKVVEAAKTRCNLERIRDLVPHPELGEYLVKMSNIIIDLISNDQVPGCEAEVTMMQCPEVPESACGRQLNEAWLCDYISWRITFMHKWAPKFLSWASSNSMLDIDMPMTPECRQFAVKCKTEGMMGKVKDMFGCDIPYCKDGKFKQRRSQCLEIRPQAVAQGFLGLATRSELRRRWSVWLTQQYPLLIPRIFQRFCATCITILFNCSALTFI